MKLPYYTARFIFLIVAVLSVCVGRAADGGSSSSSSSSSASGTSERARSEQAHKSRCEICNNSYMSLAEHLKTDKHAIKEIAWLYSTKNYAKGLELCEKRIRLGRLSHAARVQIDTLYQLCFEAKNPQAFISPSSSSSSSIAQRDDYCAICKDVFTDLRYHAGTQRHRENVYLAELLQQQRMQCISEVDAPPAVEQTESSSSSSSSSSSVSGTSKRARSEQVHKSRCEICNNSYMSLAEHLKTDKHAIKEIAWLYSTKNYAKGLELCEKRIRLGRLSRAARVQIDTLYQLCFEAKNPQAFISPSSSSSSSIAQRDDYCAICKDVFTDLRYHAGTQRHRENAYLAELLQQQRMQCISEADAPSAVELTEPEPLATESEDNCAPLLSMSSFYSPVFTSSSSSSFSSLCDAVQEEYVSDSNVDERKKRARTISSSSSSSSTSSSPSLLPSFSETKGAVMVNVAKKHIEQKKYAIALQSCESGLEIPGLMPLHKAHLKVMLGMIYTVGDRDLKPNFSHALKHYCEALAINELPEDIHAVALASMGSIYRVSDSTVQRDFATAIDFYKRALAMHKSFQMRAPKSLLSRKAQAEVLFSQGQIYSLGDDTLQKDLHKALRCYKACKGIDDLSHEMQCLVEQEIKRCEGKLACQAALGSSSSSSHSGLLSEDD